MNSLPTDKYESDYWDVLSQYYLNEKSHLNLVNEEQTTFLAINWQRIVEHEAFNELSSEQFKDKYKLRMKLTPLPEDLK